MTNEAGDREQDGGDGRAGASAKAYEDIAKAAGDGPTRRVARLGGAAPDHLVTGLGAAAPRACGD